MDRQTLIGLAVMVAGIFAAIGYGMLSSRDRATTGALLGFFLGPVGLIIAAVMRLEPTEAPAAATQPAIPIGMKKCPDCAEVIQGQARRCRFCHADVSAITGATR
jgi:hypothetical protein